MYPNMLMCSIYKYNWTFSEGIMRCHLLEYIIISSEKHDSQQAQQAINWRDFLLVSEVRGQSSGQMGLELF